MEDLDKIVLPQHASLVILEIARSTCLVLSANRQCSESPIAALRVASREDAELAWPIIVTRVVAS